MERVILKKLYVIGIGPGAADMISPRAMAALDECDVIAGYGVYVDLIKPLFPDKEYIVTPMRQEVQRCQMAIERAAAGQVTAMISSGDAGVYGMAAPIIELAEGKGIDVEVIPGITAALGGAAVLGAPIGHDFAVISLSDLLTPWELIEKRLELAAMGDMCIAIYNPASHKRADYLQKACDILMRHAAPDTICGIVKNIGREGEMSEIMTLKALRDYPADMFTTVFVGSSRTKVVDGRMVTPRGYRDV